MTRITIDIQNEHDLQLIQSLLKRLGIPSHQQETESTPVAPANGHEVATIMQHLSEQGGVSSITDPVSWQRESRTDRKLPFRD